MATPNASPTAPTADITTNSTQIATTQYVKSLVASTSISSSQISGTIATDVASATAFVSSINDYNSEVFPAQVAAGSLSAGTVYTIFSTGTTTWTAVGASSNMTGVTFLATATGTGTGTAVVNSVNPDVIATFNTAYAANTYDGQPNPIVIISNV